MPRFFNNEEERLRNYTKKRLKKKSIFEIFRIFSVTNWIILFNILVFFIVFFLAQVYGEQKIVSFVALDSISLFSGKFYLLLTSMFTHFAAWHLIANMFSLFFIGNFVERIIGRKRFFYLYIISGLFAGIFFAILSYYLGNICIIDFGTGCIGKKLFFSPDTAAVGASGAIFSLLGVLAILTPYTKVYLLAGPLIAIILESILQALYPGSPFLVMADFFVFIYVILSLFSVMSFNPRISRLSLPLLISFQALPYIAIAPLFVLGIFFDLPFGNTAHLGGLIAGMIFAIYLKNKYKKKSELIKRMFSSQKNGK